jgi:hypothetical protein
MDHTSYIPGSMSWLHGGHLTFAELYAWTQSSSTAKATTASLRSKLLLPAGRVDKMKAEPPPIMEARYLESERR